jgi:CubicO group peptidase (beta-lactamase class C family)
MSKVLNQLVCLMLAVSFSASIALVNPTEAKQSQTYDFTRVDSLLQSSLSEIGGTGCALILIQDGKVIYRKAFGNFSTDQVVPIASATKWLSGAVIMALVDEGKISLDDPAAKYLPNFTGDKANITIRQMFSHTSGLPGDTDCTRDRSGTLADCVDEIALVPMLAPAGSQFYYGSCSMHTAGRIAEIVTGKTWDEVFRDKIGGPIGMTRTDYEGLGRTDNPLIAGGARSSIDDYSRFLHMILSRGVFEGKRILSEASVAEMLKDQTFGVPLVGTPYANYASLDPSLPQTRYGVGHWLEVVDPATSAVVEHSSQGAFGCSPWIDYRRNLVGVFLPFSVLNRVMPTYLKLKDTIRSIIPISSTDLILPVVSEVITSKAKISRLKDPTIEIRWKSVDNAGVVTHDIEYASDGTSFSTTIAVGLSREVQAYTWTIPSSLPRSKSARIKVSARDAAGNVGEGITRGVLIVK